MLYFIAILVIFVSAPCVFTTLFFFTAPYGRHFRQGWGPSVSPRTGWILMELPALLVIGITVLFSGRERQPDRASAPRALGNPLPLPHVSLPLPHETERQAFPSRAHRVRRHLQQPQRIRERHVSCPCIALPRGRAFSTRKIVRRDRALRRGFPHTRVGGPRACAICARREREATRSPGAGSSSTCPTPIISARSPSGSAGRWPPGRSRASDSRSSPWQTWFRGHMPTGPGTSRSSPTIRRSASGSSRSYSEALTVRFLFHPDQLPGGEHSAGRGDILAPGMPDRGHDPVLAGDAPRTGPSCPGGLGPAACRGSDGMR